MTEQVSTLPHAGQRAVTSAHFDVRHPEELPQPLRDRYLTAWKRYTLQGLLPGFVVSSAITYAIIAVGSDGERWNWSLGKELIWWLLIIGIIGIALGSLALRARRRVDVNFPWMLALNRSERQQARTAIKNATPSTDPLLRQVEERYCVGIVKQSTGGKALLAFWAPLGVVAVVAQAWGLLLAWTPMMLQQLYVLRWRGPAQRYLRAAGLEELA